ncbi:MAG TPA: hypothetical protein PLU43_07275 [Lachnospiraceae bacterium]|nr:hypothetical protein [Lachnospiraceae bacterium]
MEYGKKFTIKTISYTLGILILLAAVTVIIDPFIHYHAPICGLAAVETDERSALVGVARNMDYDTALIGSSMSENFKESWFEDGVFGNSCVKLSLQGAHFNDYDVLFREVSKKKDLKNIVFSLDTYLLTNPPEDYPVTIPSYLSNTSYWDDASYVWNKSVLLEYLPKFLINNVTEHYNADSAYTWADDYVFSKYAARGSYNAERLLIPEEEKSYDTYFTYSDEFLADIIPYIESCPDVTFYFYSSPYSILFWDDSVRRGNTTAEICALSRVFEKLLSYDNVRIFYFQDDYDIITDLDNYRDYSHFDQPINYYMYECMRDGKKEVTLDTYYDTLLNMYQFAIAYDYESAFH